MERRQFLKYISALPSWALATEVINFFPENLLANVSPNETLQNPHFFVLILVNGGMDVTLGLEPRIHQAGEDQKDVFIEYRPEQIIQAGNLRLGPAAEALKNYHQDLAIVNGINMRRDAGHLSSLEYIASGNGDGTKAYLPVEIGQAMKSIGLAGVIQNSAIRLGNYEVAVTELQNIFSESLNSEKQNENRFLGNWSKNPSVYEMAINNYKKLRLPLQKISRELANKNPNQSLHELPPEKLISKIFQNKLSYQAVISLNDNLDTHSNHAGKDGVPGSHWMAQSQVWAQVAEFFKAFKNTEFNKGSLFDSTTFMVASEFSRTPFLNNSNGKDHNPYTNSVLLAGRKIKGGTTVGSSHIIKRTNSKSSLHIATPLDYSNGNLVTIADSQSLNNKKVNFIYPENLARTLVHGFGNPSGIISVNMNTPIIPGVLKV